jgi:hypothetical protein
VLNDEYRKSRNTDKPFTASPEEAKAAWYEMNNTEIDRRRKHDKRFGKRKGWASDLNLREEAEAED